MYCFILLYSNKRDTIQKVLRVDVNRGLKYVYMPGKEGLWSVWSRGMWPGPHQVWDTVTANSCVNVGKLPPFSRAQCAHL